MKKLTITESCLIKTEKSNYDINNNKLWLCVDSLFSKKDVKVAITKFLGSPPLKINSLPFVERKRKLSKASKEVVKGSIKKFVVIISDIAIAKEKFKVS